MSMGMQATSAPKIRERHITVKGREYVRHDVDFGVASGRRNRATFKTEAKARRAIREWQQRQKVNTIT